MIHGRKVVGLIPARAESVRVPDKNIQLVGGTSLVGWAILAARESKYIDTIVVSTDGSWIASEAFKWGADIVLKRPASLSGPKVTSHDVAAHADAHVPGDLIVLLQPTSPARTGDLIDACINRSYRSLRSVYTVSDKDLKQNGMIYVVPSKSLYKEPDVFAETCGDGFVVPVSIDIDSWEDLIEAERLYKTNRQCFPELLDKRGT